MKYLLLAGAIALAGCGRLTPPVATARVCIDPVVDMDSQFSFDEQVPPGGNLRTRRRYLEAAAKQRAGDCNAVYRYRKGVELDSDRVVYGDDWEIHRLEGYIRAHLPSDIYDY